MSCHKRMKKHCVKNTQNLVGRLEAALAMAWQGLVCLVLVVRWSDGQIGHGFLKSTVFANAVRLCEKPCFLLNLVFEKHK